jgi:hypothetical protein
MTIILDGTTGITTPAINSSGDLELPGGTANGVLYLNGSKVATSGSALVFDGTNLGVGTSSPGFKLHVNDTAIAIQGASFPALKFLDGSGNTDSEIYFGAGGGDDLNINNYVNGPMIFRTNNAERARFASGGEFLVTADGTSTTFTSNGQVALKRSNDDPYISWHKNDGTRIGFFQMRGSAASGLGLEVAQDLYFLTNSTERARITSGGAFLVGETSTEGVADAVIGFKGGQILRKYGASIAASGTVDFTINPGGGGYIGFLAVANSADGNAAVRTYTTFSVFGRSTSSSIQQISTTTAGGGVSFTVTTPSDGVIRITNTSAGATNIQAYFFGGLAT